jgi:hypothetical protein
MAAHGHHLTIQVSVGVEGSTVTLSTPGKKPPPLPSPLREGQLPTLRLHLRKKLDEFARLADDATILPDSKRWQKTDAAMKCLRDVGTELGSRLFRFQDLPFIEQFCRDACRWDKNRAAIPSIEFIVGNVAIAPFEFIPLFQKKSPGPITGAADLEAEARSYPGFIGVIKRTIQSAPAPASPLVGRPSLRGRVFQYAPLEAVSRVVQDLQESGVSLSPHFPQQNLAPHTFDSRILQLFRTSREQIFYFGCHCDTTDGDAMNHTVILTHSDRRESRRFYLGALNRDFYQNGPHAPYGPLVFMNACGGVSVMPSGLISFPEVFLLGNFAGFIGTESIIPDKTATAFASTFFKKFLAGYTLGQSLFAARRRLLDRGNPLGILYTAYASSDLLALRAK